jgi:hypothetical protein
MRVVYKYPLEFGREINELVLPVTSEILDIGFQQREYFGDDLFVWVLVDKNCKEKELFEIIMLGTGIETPINHNDLNHLKTVHKDGYVWHFFLRS